MAKARDSSVLTTLLFTDIVGSTVVAEEMGDRRWRELLARHNRILRDALKEFGGRELDSAGDGLFARFDSTAAAIRSACSAQDAVRELGVEIRAGVHIGECELLDGKLSGINVHVAARTMGKATAGQVLVTANVRDIVRGSGFGFSDCGTHELHGIVDDWHLFEVTSVDDAPRPQLPSEQESRARRDAIVPPPLVKRRNVRLAGIMAVAVALIAAASIALVHSAGQAAKGPLTGCMVTAQPPLNDHAFNQAVFDGLTDAATKWGIGVQDKVSQIATPAEWTRHIDEFAREGCGLIATVGFVMADPTRAAARSNPARRFLVTDANASGGLKNVMSVAFRSQQAAFEAGYLAAGTTRTGKVATFGGLPIPQVIDYMNGFAAGVLYFNRLNRANVKLLGWDPRTQSGAFVSLDPGNLDAFQDTASAASISARLISGGADIVMPVDGPAGEVGAGRAAQGRIGTLLIGVDSDQHFSTPQYEPLWLTSVLKIYRRMVYIAMGNVVHGQFKGGVLYGTVANGGVGLAPFYELASRIPRSVRTRLAAVRRGIANGSISVDPATYSRH
jgi:basic membrane protein A